MHSDVVRVRGRVCDVELHAERDHRVCLNGVVKEDERNGCVEVHGGGVVEAHVRGRGCTPQAGTVAATATGGSVGWEGE